MKTNIIFYLLFILLFGCELELEKANPLENLEVITGSISTVGTTYGTVQGNILTNSINGVEDYGHCWSADELPTVKDYHTSFGEFTGEKIYQSDLNGLSVNVPYYVRAYAIANNNIIYGDQITIETVWEGDIPLVETGLPSSITSNSVVVSAEIIEQGQSSVTRYGHCWSTMNNPSLTDENSEFNTSGVIVDTFITSLTNLDEETKYYYRSYAENDDGISFGSIKSFSTTDGKPSVSTEDIIEITSNSAIAEGMIMGEGDSPITMYGHCWSTNPDPTISDSKTEFSNTNNTGSIFISNLNNLSPVQDYFVRSYAINSYGTSYGNQLSFSTNNGLAAVSTDSYNCVGSLTDLEGEILSIGDGIIQHGHYWSTTPGLNSNNYEGKTELGSTNNTGNFISQEINLNANTTYYYMSYAVTQSGTSTGDEMILSTGSPWINVTTLSGIHPNNNAFHIINSNNIWAVGSSVWNWDGTSWNNISIPCDNLYAVHGTSSNNIWVVGYPSSTSNTEELWHWNGNNWTQKNSPADFKLDILVFNNSIFVGGNNSNAHGFYRSDDNANTWNFISPGSTSGPSSSWIDMDGSDADNIWVASSLGINKYNGVSWINQNTPGSGSAWSGPYVECLSVLDNNTAFATTSPELTSLWDFPDVTVCQSTSWQSLISSTDVSSMGLGTSWSYTPVYPLSLNEVWFGANKIFKYDGNNWMPETGDIGDNIVIIKMINDTEGWAVTGNGTVLRRQ